MNRRLILAAAMALAGLSSTQVWADTAAAAVSSVVAKARAAGLQAQWLSAQNEVQMARSVLAQSTRMKLDALKPQAPNVQVSWPPRA